MSDDRPVPGPPKTAGGKQQGDQPTKDDASTGSESPEEGAAAEQTAEDARID
ncbi:hypothetical protein AB0N73_05210 [Microbacterium sp. NPDC089189]|uniref:hypothetical protein n=1 Tax=Microbacterium sp. NPDC089189 TaxID=3154972 RepID=UPI003412C359